MVGTGAILFGLLNAFVLLCAGAAALPPARDRDVLAGAATILVIWLFSLSVQTIFYSNLALSSVFLVDFLFFISFYLIARRRRTDRVGQVRERDWASYVAFIFAAIAVIELTHFAWRVEAPYRNALILALIAVNAALAGGIFRGFGARGLFVLTAGLGLLFGSSLYAFNLTLNLLAAAASLIVLGQAIRGVQRNVRAWTRRPQEHERDRINDDISALTVG